MQAPINSTDSSYLHTISSHDISLDSSIYSSPRAPEFEISMEKSDVDNDDGSTDAESVSSVLSNVDESTVASASTHTSGV